MNEPLDSLSANERLRGFAARAFPDRPGVVSVEITRVLPEMWDRLAQAAGVDNRRLAHAIASQMGNRAAEETLIVDQFAAALVPEKLARDLYVLPLREEAGKLVVAAACPTDLGALSRVRFVADRSLTVLIAPPDQIADAVILAYSRLAEIQGARLGTVRWATDGGIAENGEVEKSAVVRLARSLVVKAIQQRASDLHLQPFSGGGVARIRVDGILQRLAFVPGPVLAQLVRYFKNQAGLDSTNDRVAQDGRMSLILGDHDYDLRLSVIPASRGERLVIRILDQERSYRLSGAGFSLAAIQALRRMSANASGVLLLTGPTGSGKTSTLYGVLAELNRVGVSIITVENPVEYRVTGISQVEVDLKAGLTFASALRTILRQDPDIILIGEIRDSETAEIAMQAALTGHLVLTTLHTNDALTAVPRLLDLGVKPAVVADAVIGVVAQRLLRRLCGKCRARVNEPLRPDEQLFFDVVGERPAYRAVGCSDCNGTGYWGRFPVTEIAEFTPELRRAIAGGDSDVAKLHEHQTGLLPTMSGTAARRVISGDTTVGEIARVIGQRLWLELASEFRRPIPGNAAGVTGREDVDGRGPAVLLFGLDDAHSTPLAAALVDSGFRVCQPASPDDTRRTLESGEDIVLLVIDLDAGGAHLNRSLLVQLREAVAWSRLPVLVIVPRDDSALHAILEEHGVSDYLVKPVDPARLVARCRAVLAR